jgi:predicted Fe-S protein YdhL (DUF1289 family)
MSDNLIKKEPPGPTDELTGPDKKLLKIKRADRVDTTVPSPCIDVCRYSVYDTLRNDYYVKVIDGGATFHSTTEKLCKGCFRNKTEIIYWHGWHAPRKLQALEDIKKRKEKISEGK